MLVIIPGEYPQVVYRTISYKTEFCIYVYKLYLTNCYLEKRVF